MKDYDPAAFNSLTNLEEFQRHQFFFFTHERMTDFLAMDALLAIEMRGADICNLVDCIQRALDDARGAEAPDTERLYSLTRSIVAMAAAMQTPLDALNARVRFLELELTKAAHRQPVAA